MKIKIVVLSLTIVTIFSLIRYVFWSSAGADSVMGISHDLACPCECPMVLEDCHMSCGMEWKDMIGQRLMTGSTKDDIEGYFFKRFGKESMLTPLQRISGKWYQITRGGFPISDIALFISIMIVWSGVLYFVITGTIDLFKKKIAIS
ncbi:MAG: cytochrome c-type biogenesis protein CcmH [Nitrospinota bacterium]